MATGDPGHHECRKWRRYWGQAVLFFLTLLLAGKLHTDDEFSRMSDALDKEKEAHEETRRALSLAGERADAAVKASELIADAFSARAGGGRAMRWNRKKGQEEVQAATVSLETARKDRISQQAKLTAEQVTVLARLRKLARDNHLAELVLEALTEGRGKGGT